MNPVHYGGVDPVRVPVPAETTEWEARFAPVARDHRRRVRQMIGALALTIASSALVASVPGLLYPGAVLFFGSLIWTLVAVSRIQKLVCPACRAELDRLKTFCPDCGAGGLEVVEGLMTGAVCESCKRDLFPRNGRSYPIHFCTRCGVLLDRLGV